ncbi:hypothetical protein FC98_GL000985 [Lentilactobacillus kisonensis DSM 19906 = JCM 15041]|uniref:Uncharacterized protein n=1 Tax=Lentilactobacillus kisonensis DSM 19906 = JCM 15041 TaxID=1423766 RepID=A0A0R1NLW6_9LACO|nr:hypothetical protein FC98_GL000985 [Lentilactobacillus kisonensis DSM 19906 = JCM 15041]
MVIIISEYQILGSNTYGKPGMWYVMAVSIIIQLVVIGTSLITGATVIGDLYQGFCAFVFVMFISVALLCLPGNLELISILVGVIGIANCSCYFILKLRSGEKRP